MYYSTLMVRVISHGIPKANRIDPPIDAFRKDQELAEAL
jgi:hypothetical protein